MTENSHKLSFNLPAQEQQLLIDELHGIAMRYMQKERSQHTLQATALVNEAYLKLFDKSIHAENRPHLIAIIARQMRLILVDHARNKLAAKRGGDAINMTFANTPDGNELATLELIHLDRLLNEFTDLDPRAAEIFELKLFSTLTNAEVAQLLDISVATVERDSRAAKAWLALALDANK